MYNYFPKSVYVDSSTACVERLKAVYSKGSSLFVGIITKQHLDKLLRQGNIVIEEVKKFYSAAWNFYIAAAEYVIYNLPLENDLLKNSEFGCISSRR